MSEMKYSMKACLVERLSHWSPLFSAQRRFLRGSWFLMRKLRRPGWNAVKHAARGVKSVVKLGAAEAPRRLAQPPTQNSCTARHHIAHGYFRRMKTADAFLTLSDRAK